MANILPFADRKTGTVDRLCADQIEVMHRAETGPAQEDVRASLEFGCGALQQQWAHRLHGRLRRRVSWKDYVL